MAQKGRQGRTKDGELRPRLAFRVGVAGERDVDERDPRLAVAVDACLSALRDQIAGLGLDPESARAYAERGPGDGPIDLTLVSALGEGAERLAARRAVKFSARLYAAQPFPHDAGVDELRASAAAFDLLSRADRFTLDGERGDAEATEEALAAAGRYVAANCDLLIAVWDGTRGGVAETVEWALRAGLPVWWIAAREDLPSRWLRGLAELAAPDLAPWGAEAFAALATHLARTISPPTTQAPQRGGALGFLATVVRTFVRPDWPPLDEFYAEKPRRQRAVWSVYAELMNLIAPPVGRAVAAEAGAPGVWTDLYRLADALSQDYGDRYRSSYVLVAVLCVIAAAATAFGGEADPVLQGAFALVALAAGFGAVGFVVLNLAWGWRERWFAYRLLAELARKQRLLALIGQSAAPGDAFAGAAFGEEWEEAPRMAWIAWLYAAHRRAARPPKGPMAEAKREALAQALQMVEQQLAFHKLRAGRMRLAGRRLRFVCEGFVLAALALFVAKLGLVEAGQFGAIPQIVLWTAMASAFAAATFGVRVQAEFVEAENQSRHRLALLQAARVELRILGAGPIDAPLGSAHLARTLGVLAAGALRDVPGFAHLFDTRAP